VPKIGLANGMTPHNRLSHDRIERFCGTFGLKIPILMAPMAGASPRLLASAVANAGGLGACGALLLPPEAIRNWAEEFNAHSDGGFQINLWIPGPAPVRDPVAEDAMRGFLSQWTPDQLATPGDSGLPDFTEQCEAMLDIRPRVISSIMGLYTEPYVRRMKEAGIHWFATVTTVAEAKAAEAAGADAVIAQGMEAGGHRGAFSSDEAMSKMVGLFSLLPAVCDAVSLPVIAAGGIADGRGVAAALTLGASAVQIGTGLLRCPEARLPSAWADAIGKANPEDTIVTQAFSGRPGRAIRTAYTNAAEGPGAPQILPYPVQGLLTQPMRMNALHANDMATMQAWAGQSARLARAEPAASLVTGIWNDAIQIMPQLDVSMTR
jgi:nitronate monooxygenase